MKFTYLTNASAGEIWLIDDAGHLLESKPVYAEGATWMRVPRSAAGREVRAVLHARSGAQSAVATRISRASRRRGKRHERAEQYAGIARTFERARFARRYGNRNAAGHARRRARYAQR